MGNLCGRVGRRRANSLAHNPAMAWLQKSPPHGAKLRASRAISRPVFVLSARHAAALSGACCRGLRDWGMGERGPVRALEARRSARADRAAAGRAVRLRGLNESAGGSPGSGSAPRRPGSSPCCHVGRERPDWQVASLCRCDREQVRARPSGSESASRPSVRPCRCVGPRCRGVWKVAMTAARKGERGAPRARGGRARLPARLGTLIRRGSMGRSRGRRGARPDDG